MGAKAESLVRIILLWLVAYPAKSSVVSLILAIPIAQAEGCSFDEAFWYSLMRMTLTDVQLTDFAPAGVGGLAIAFLAGILQVTVFIFFVGLTAGPMVDPWVDFFGAADVKTAHRKFLPFCLVVYPAAALLFAALLGAPLSLSEGWPAADGFMLVLGELTVTGMAWGHTKPLTYAGKVLGVMAGIVAMAFFGLVIAVGSVPLLGFGLKFDESKVVKTLGPLVLNGEQRAEILRRTPPKEVGVVPAEEEIEI